ncbi:unnamed protein product [Malus baccata var. baccata]
MQGLKKKKRLKVEDTKNGNEVQVVEGCWQTPPLDIMENIIQRLDLLDRIRGLSILCKYWSSIALRRGIGSVRQFPCPKYLGLEFTILPDGNVIKLGLSKRNQGRFHSSCKGWLIMVNEENFKLFQRSGDRKADRFLLKIALSSSNISECRVAAIFSSMEIGVCGLGKKGWSICPMLDDRKESPLCLLFSSCRMLYVLIKKKTRRLRNHDFLVYKVDLEDGGSFIEVQSLGNQILFVTSRGCSFSLSVSNFTGLEANCIYFAELGVSSYRYRLVRKRDGTEQNGTGQDGTEQDSMLCLVRARRNGTVVPKTSMCDFSHHFYLDGQKFGQSREYYYHASPKLMRGLSWFIPNL